MNKGAYIVRIDSPYPAGPYTIVSTTYNGWVKLTNGKFTFNARTTDIVYGEKNALKSALRCLKYRKRNIKKDINQVKEKLRELS